MRQERTGTAAGDLDARVRRHVRRSEPPSPKLPVSETAGLKCAPLIGPSIAMSTANTATVAPVLRRQCDPNVPAGEALAP